MKSNEKMINRFEDALTELLKIKHLSKITVTDITGQCNVTRQIFYRYFEDKFHLVAYICNNQYKENLQISNTFECNTTILNLINGIKAQKEFYQYAVQNDSDNVIYNIMYNHTVGMYRGVIQYRTGKLLSDNINFLLILYCRGGIDILIDWIRTGMQMPCEQLRDLFIEAMPDQIFELLTNIEVPVTYLLDCNPCNSTP
ncbi:TetR/AcrR family transcriptional regulator [Anaeromicropila herbilytica]|uniref:TetR family transcriptional regulator n=1 Tax=Anaeromicropila herbilytica TaxID=2785025 RepID=A0A7R7EPU9_9FIRM|nr:TetR/AcrR family transcriptional regulator [Anaeromicropila herbilytica]BCN32297.1 TetR family transcriptional regulator [Anaeromicropila herbilytica]